MRRKNLCIAIAALSIAIGISESGWAETTNHSYPSLTYSGSQQYTVEKETSLAALWSSPDVGSAAGNAHKTLEIFATHLDNGFPTSLDWDAVIARQLRFSAVGAGDSVIERNANPIVLEDIGPTCIHNCQIPEPSSLILVTTLVTTALLGLGMKTRYCGKRL